MSAKLHLHNRKAGEYHPASVVPGGEEPSAQRPPQFTVEGQTKLGVETADVGAALVVDEGHGTEPLAEKFIFELPRNVPRPRPFQNLRHEIVPPLDIQGKPVLQGGPVLEHEVVVSPLHFEELRNAVAGRIGVGTHAKLGPGMKPFDLVVKSRIEGVVEIEAPHQIAMPLTVFDEGVELQKVA